jgi:hypothetical protein
MTEPYRPRLVKISNKRIVISCWNCAFLDIEEQCNLTSRNVDDDDTDNPRMPSWCPLLKGPVVIETVHELEK